MIKLNDKLLGLMTSSYKDPVSSKLRVKKIVRVENSDSAVTHILCEVVRMGVFSEGKNIKRKE